MLEECIWDKRFSSRILFLDKATFCLNGLIHRQLCRPSLSRPHIHNPQTPNLWMSTIGHPIATSAPRVTLGKKRYV